MATWCQVHDVLSFLYRNISGVHFVPSEVPARDDHWTGLELDWIRIRTVTSLFGFGLESSEISDLRNF